MPFSSFTERLIATNKVGVDTTLSALNITLNSLEKLSALNISTTRSILNEQLEGSHDLLGAKSLPQALSQKNTLGQAQIEQLIAYSRHLYGITSESQAALAKLLEVTHGELNQSIASFLDGYAQSAKHADVAVAAVKSAISAANSAFENINKATRQVSSIAEASVNAATNATVRAVNSATPSQKKAA